jgi:hypothetical protein
MSIAPEINNWFTDQLDYEGYGYAKFSDPQGVAEGPVKIRFDESGKTLVEMKVEKIIPQPLLPLLFFDTKTTYASSELSALFPELKEGTEVLAFGSNSKRNLCTKLTVTTSEGTFSTHGEISYNSQYTPADATLHFQALLQFESKNSGNAKYWVLPLSNFLSCFAEFDPSLEHHPLFILKELQKEENLHLILFNFANAKGFIEPLADYEERKRKLEEGEIKSLITSVMIGEIGSNSIEISDIYNWFSWDFLLLLSFATGTKVESPWIELRDEQGNLVRRVHYNFSLPKIIKKRHIILKECRPLDTGIGALLTQAQESESFKKPHLRILLQHILQGGPSNTSMEDRMTYLSRGLDGLCRHYGVTTQDFGKDLFAHHASSVKEILKRASKEIQELAKDAALNGDGSQSALLNRIAERTKQGPMGGKDKAFGLAIVNLLKLPRFDLPDANVLTYYSSPVTKKDWPSTLSYYRGVVLHEGYFGSPESIDHNDVIVIMNHLHDIMVRIAFRIVGYTGNYQPTVKSTNALDPVDWVTSTSLPSQLGYQ